MSVTGMAGDNDKAGDSLVEKMAPKLIALLKSKFLSRKFLTPIAFALLAYLNRKFALGLTEEDLQRIVAVAMTFILGEATVDVLRAKGVK